MFVQFADSTETTIIAIFGCPQDATAYPNQGQIDDSDARYQAFVNPTATLAGAQAAQIAMLQADYVSAINAPVSFKNAAGVTSTYHCGSTLAVNGMTGQQNLAACIGAGSSAWTMGKWLDVNGVAQTFTFADLQGLAAAAEAVEVPDWQDLIAKIAAVQAATTVAAVQAVVWP